MFWSMGHRRHGGGDGGQAVANPGTYIYAPHMLLSMFREDCPCPKVNCERHGYCEPCRAYHGAKGKLPRCERPPGLLTKLFKKK